MDTRRSFIKKAMLLSGATGVSQFLPASVQKAFAIDPEPGSTYLDAEHIVLLMQENRSFDHTYGTLQGVRGFNDPRAIILPNKNLVWLQTSEAGETYAPFHLDIRDTKITWMGSLPHSWANQTDARNKGKYDGWLEAKKPDNEEYEGMPLTMGYYTREDIPFYYALADAFTVCDQHFCSSLTGTTPNRLYFWTGTIRAEQNENSKANVWNEDADYDTMVNWATFPERLEENGISWKIYQNDISVDGGFTEEEDDWLSNFGDNPIEYFTQYNVKLSERYINYLQKMAAALPGEIEDMEKKIQSLSSTDKEFEKLENDLKDKKETLDKVTHDLPLCTREKYEKLSQYEKNLHEKAFSANKKDPFFYQLDTLKYEDGSVEREVTIPKGDVLHQFREDVNTGKLPAVSWLVAPENFSDHPSSAWYGAWYVSEVLDILTQNPEVWKKTIFILTYDENDGYFDHVPPFVAPNPHDRDTGKTSEGIDTSVDYVSMEQERKKTGTDEKYMRESSIGLGYRVPLVIASPWSRGGWVCSQVFDHTSDLQFLEKFLSKKAGKKIVEPNISSWRRTVCGDLGSVFREYKGEKISIPPVVEKDAFIESIHKAKFKEVPRDYKKLNELEIEQVNNNPRLSAFIPRQEKGIRPSCALPYELYVDGRISTDKKSFEIRFEAKNDVFSERSAGSPFTVYALSKHLQENLRVWSYAVAAGDSLIDSWHIEDFENSLYHLLVYGPNGFFREFAGNSNDPDFDILCTYQHDSINPKKLTGNIELTLLNKGDAQNYTVDIIDNMYKTGTQTKLLGPANSENGQIRIVPDLSKSYGWYDFSVKIKGNSVFEKRYAGRVETGKVGHTDPAMGKVIT